MSDDKKLEMQFFCKIETTLSFLRQCHKGNVFLITISPWSRDQAVF